MSTPNNSKAALNKQGREFIQSAAAFNRSEIDMVRRNSKIAWRIAIGCLVITGMAIGAVAALTPLKTVQPYVIRVDNNTGATDIVTTLKQSEKTYGEVIDKYWLAQYIKYRESYDWQTIQTTYDATMLLSAQPVQQEFAKIYTDNNPNAPHKILKDRFKVIVNVKAISFVGQMAQIRFDKQLIPLTGDLSKTTPPQQLIATVAFDYANQPMQEKDRLVNPLGFQITSYHVDPENTP
ncbi:MAG: type IV secretion system protein [Snodgrassella sp.]|uniref:virB8 family protein n=1 Tax=Snodgrassella sp. TaxID=2815304 RepID=UPI00258AFDFF|nr:type IV secretion system protein [Snodgrassella sp.]MCO6520579.1 type IV secretion system protein [Snodgrassella sp.]